jgi:hypothetical protein
MTAKAISRKEFDSFKPARMPGIEQIVEEVEWFADAAGNVIGVLARDRADNDWSFAVLGRDERGQFRAIDMATSVATRDEARQQLTAKIGEHAATGAEVFPQGD